MSNKHLQSLLFCLVMLVTDAIVSQAKENLVETNKSNTPKTIWRDPFYTGPFGVRTWTDISGDHRMEGRFVELLPDKIVRLQRPNGRFLRIQFSQLSRADRELVQQITLK